MPATIRRSAQNSNVYRAYGIMSSDTARGVSTERGAVQSGRVESFSFCDSCGFASREILNNCPKCHKEIREKAQLGLVDLFEAEENTQITSAEDARQRVNFDS